MLLLPVQQLLLCLSTLAYVHTWNMRCMSGLGVFLGLRASQGLPSSSLSESMQFKHTMHEV